MKIVYNSNGFGLHLSADEMKMLSRKLNLTLNQHNKGSNETWFKEVYWEDFRADPRLVELVEAGVLSNKNLRIVEIPDTATWDIDTDWHTYENVSCSTKEAMMSQLESLFEELSDSLYYADKVLYREDITEALNEAYRSIIKAIQLTKGESK